MLKAIREVWDSIFPAAPRTIADIVGRERSGVRWYNMDSRQQVTEAALTAYYLQNPDGQWHVQRSPLERRPLVAAYGLMPFTWADVRALDAA